MFTEGQINVLPNADHMPEEFRGGIRSLDVYRLRLNHRSKAVIQGLSNAPKPHYSLHKWHEGKGFPVGLLERREATDAYCGQNSASKTVRYIQLCFIRFDVYLVLYFKAIYLQHTFSIQKLKLKQALVFEEDSTC